MEIKIIEYKDTKDFILNKHYAQRMPSIKWAFGLYDDSELIGVLTIGKPASNALCEGICGKEHKSKVWELNRLITIDNLPKNTLSYFVGGCLKLLKHEDIILVSYADSGAGHNGYIYQATNFIYTGATKERTDKYTPSGKHSRHYTDEHKHLRKYRSSKHRYVYFIGKNKKLYRKLLNYKVLPYPKNENKNYILGERLKTKVIDKNTDKIFYE